MDELVSNDIENMKMPTARLKATPHPGSIPENMKPSLKCNDTGFLITMKCLHFV